MSSIRDFFDSTMREPRAIVSASSCGSVGFTTRPWRTSGFGACRGATSMGLLSTSSSLAALPRFSFLSWSFFRFSFRSCLSVSGSWGRSLSSISCIAPPSVESESLSRSSGMIAPPSSPSTGWKMSWLNHRLARCSALRASSVPSSGAGTMAPLPFLPSPSSASRLRFGTGPSARASRASPSILLEAGFWRLRSIMSSPSLSSSSSSSLSLFFSA
mmetsp:Transcript_11322/g.33575  ORF Transcript_11322/g.33575 Transcript_11322/m.33575 type:complete len:215 (-) Transcript_11322:1907-2551(-)